MGATRAMVRKLGDLARIALTEDDISRFAEQIDRVVEYFQMVKGLQLGDVLPTSHVVDVECFRRPDQVVRTQPDSEHRLPYLNRYGYFQVPRILPDEGLAGPAEAHMPEAPAPGTNQAKVSEMSGSAPGIVRGQVNSGRVSRLDADLCDLTIHELAQRMRQGEISPYDIMVSVAERIARQEQGINAFTTLLLEQAMELARSMPQPDSSASLIYGIPIAIKDNICIKGTRTTCASNILRDFVSPYDAFVVTQIRAAQGIIVGKTNLDEFAMGASSETSCFGPVHNPHNRERVAGGSSGGSAAVVSYGGAIAALGSDTGGSVRQPAAFCGVVGLKPTYGRVSRYGLVAFASSLDQIGPITRDVTDAAIMLSAIAGRDPHDSTSLDKEVGSFLPLAAGVKGLKIGIPRECFASGLDLGIQEQVQGLLHGIEPEAQGVKPISLPMMCYAIPAYYLVCMAEASSNLARYDGVRYGLRAQGCVTLEEQYRQTRRLGFADEVKRRILLGTYGLSKGSFDEYYGTGQKVRTLIRQDFEIAFRDVDVIVMPTTPHPAFRIGEKIDDPLAMYLEDTYTTLPSLAGLPAISIPCPKPVDRLPVGLQLIGRPFEEAVVLRAAWTFECLGKNLGAR